MPRLRTLLAATAVAAVGASLATIPAPSDAASPLTNFALGATAWGTRVTGGKVPVDSVDTANSTLGCTRAAGRTSSNSTAATKIAGFGTIGATTTKVWTTRSNGVVSSYAQQKIASISLVQSAIGSLSIDGLTTTARAYHDAKGFHATATHTLGTISATLGGRKFPVASLPSPGRSLTIPGLATISVGVPNVQVLPHQGHVDTDAISIKVLSTGTTARIGHAAATVQDGAPTGVFGGWSDAVDGNLLAGTVTIGANPRTNSLCRGTKGVLRQKSLAGLPLGSILPASVSGLSSGERTNQTPAGASGYTFGRVGNVNLGNGQIKITGLRAQANLTWKKGKWAARTNSAGTTATSVVVAGKSIPLSQLGSALSKVNIPGLVGIKTNVIKHPDSRTIEVIALQLTVLDATKQTKSVVNLGHAKLGFWSRH